MRRLVLAAGLLVLTALPSFAQVPDYDTEAYCRRVSTDRGQLSQDKFNYCLRTERSARARSARAGAARRSHCTYVGSSAGPDALGEGSYGAFVTCLEGRDDGTGTER